MDMDWNRISDMKNLDTEIFVAGKSLVAAQTC